jgi:hypothetical protein
MLINLSVENIKKTIKVNDGMFVNGSVIIKLIVLKDEKNDRIINFDYTID